MAVDTKSTTDVNAVADPTEAQSAAAAAETSAATLTRGCPTSLSMGLVLLACHTLYCALVRAYALYAASRSKLFQGRYTATTSTLACTF
jgi:hypothetical protein